MELKIKCLKPYLLFILLCSSFSVFAQMKNDSRKLLQGKWLLESVSAYKVNDIKPVNIDSTNIEIYSQIEIKEDMAILSNKENIREVNYILDETGFRFATPSVMYITEWSVAGDKLYLLQIIPSLFDETKDVFVSLIYKHK